MYLQTTLVIFALNVVLSVCTAVNAHIIYVDTDAPGADNGSSWNDAYNYLQDALNAAMATDEIRVAQGAYEPDQGTGITAGDRFATFQLVNGVTVKGGYAGFGQPNPDTRNIELYETILSGDLAGNDGANFANNTENSYQVVTGSGTDATAVLDGFTITAGNANGTGIYRYGSRGSTGTVQACITIRVLLRWQIVPSGKTGQVPAVAVECTTPAALC
jgi:hypothetical protein